MLDENVSLLMRRDLLDLSETEPPFEHRNPCNRWQEAYLDQKTVRNDVHSESVQDQTPEAALGFDQLYKSQQLLCSMRHKYFEGLEWSCIPESMASSFFSSTLSSFVLVKDFYIAHWCIRARIRKNRLLWERKLSNRTGTHTST